MIKCLAIDDEPLALDIIQNYLDKASDFQLVARCTSANEALEALTKFEIDLIFLDIQMSDITGIEFLKSLRNPPLVIFTTAYENYALEGYELDIVDYLLKPIPPERFLKSLTKAREILSFRKSKDEIIQDHIFVRSDYQLVKINFNDIIYIEGLKDYVKIFNGPKPVFSHQNLKSIESKLPSDQFIRIHKSYIISIKKIQAVQKSNINVAGIEIPVGESYKEQLSKILK